ncbi:MAG: DegT/DnrJ/EryC1/StrS family aminotransferase [Verrucomicrobiae bacterium]|nr:DegT/DnrJ/EryC1/StrS family aminotransferase [Verrucomicrobiae bacterium]
MNVPLLDLGRQHQAIETELREAFNTVLRHGKFVLGPEVAEFEREIAPFCGAKHAVSCASGSDALLLALMAFDVGPGDEVITSPYSFFATASCIARLGAKAVFADISLESYNLDPDEVRKKITPRTKAILPVHLYGQAAEMAPWLEEAKRRGIRVIEDAAQAIGAHYRGKPVGGFGDVGCFSFFPSKNLGGFGDGGLMTTNDEDLAGKLRILRVHGAEPKYYHGLLGINSRLDTIQAALLRAKLPRLEGWARARARNAALYAKLLTEAGVARFAAEGEGEGADASSEKGGAPFILPAARQSRHVYNQFILRARAPAMRDRLRDHLRESGVGTEIYYPVPLHLQECFAGWGYRAGDLPRAERAAASTLALPIFPELTETEIAYVAQAIAEFCEGRSRARAGSRRGRSDGRGESRRPQS